MTAKQYKGVIEYQYKLRAFHTTIPDVNARAFLLSQRNHCIRDVATTKNFTYNHTNAFVQLTMFYYAVPYPASGLYHSQNKKYVEQFGLT